jgi:hypothetical protein
MECVEWIMPTGGFSWNREGKAKFAQMFPLQEIQTMIQEGTTNQ